MLLHGLASKNKRSANCALRAMADGFDRQVAFQLLRAQKDVSIIVKMLDDKDLELRKAALNIVALLSQYADSTAFERGCGRHLSKDMQLVVKTAAARLPPVASAGEEASCLDVSHLSEVSVQANAVRQAAPTKHLSSGTGNDANAPRIPLSVRAATPTKQRPGSAAAGAEANPPARPETPTRRSAAAAAERETAASRMPAPTRARTSGAAAVAVAETACSPASKVAGSALGREASPRPSGGGTLALSPSASRLRPRIASPIRRNQSEVAAASE